jgi:hypothetical protein
MPISLSKRGNEQHCVLHFLEARRPFLRPVIDYGLAIGPYPEEGRCIRTGRAPRRAFLPRLGVIGRGRAAGTPARRATLQDRDVNVSSPTVMDQDCSTIRGRLRGNPTETRTLPLIGARSSVDERARRKLPFCQLFRGSRLAVVTSTMIGAPVTAEFEQHHRWRRVRYPMS